VKELDKLPFSKRYKERIENGKINVFISDDANYQIFKHLEGYDESIRFTNFSGGYDCKMVSERALNDIKNFYVPKGYHNKKFFEITDFYELKYSPSYSILDGIEFFSRNLMGEYGQNRLKDDMNLIFESNKINIKFDGFKIVLIDIDLDKYKITEFPMEKVVEEYLKEADDLYVRGDKRLALERVWDAFERIKTIYCKKANLDKKGSSVRLLKTLAGDSDEFYSLLNNEFITLTNIGNKFRIRKHETDKTEINDNLHFEYLYKRCLSLMRLISEKIVILESKED